MILGHVTHFLRSGRSAVILVTTAGKVGAEAARLLREQDLPVRVLARDPDKQAAKALAAAGAQITAGDTPSLEPIALSIVTECHIAIQPYQGLRDLCVMGSRRAGHQRPAPAHQAAAVVSQRHGQHQATAKLSTEIWPGSRRLCMTRAVGTPAPAQVSAPIQHPARKQRELTQ
jgi:hypothetical protein